MQEEISQVFTNFFTKTSQPRRERISRDRRDTRACDRMQMAERRLPVTSVRPLSDPNARGLIAANTGPPYFSLSSPLPSRARALSCTLTNVSGAHPRSCPVIRITPMVTRINHRHFARTSRLNRAQ